MPPDIWGVGAFATENGSRSQRSAGMFTFDDDRWRYRGGIGGVSLNLDFYGIGGNLPIPVDRSIGYNLEGFASFQQGMLRLGDSDTFVGARWIYLDLESRLDVEAGDTGLEPKQLARRSSGLGVVVEHDSRDNIFTPNGGCSARLEGTFYDDAFGSDNRFQAYRAHVFAYFPSGDRLSLGLRADGRAARGDVPFYMLPFIDLRGVPAVRYQDTNTAVLETEVRYDVTERWSLIGFIGPAARGASRTSFSDAGPAVSKGVGFRYLVARRLACTRASTTRGGPRTKFSTSRSAMPGGEHAMTAEHTMTASIACGCARVAALALCFANQANAQQHDADELAKQLSNPVAA